MTGAGQRRWRAVPWVVVVVLVVAGVAIWLGLSQTGRDETEPPSVGSDSQTGGDPTGSGQAADADDSTAAPSDGGSAEESTEAPEVVGFDPQGTRPSTAPPEAPVLTDGAGPELEPVEPASVVEAPGEVVVSLVSIESVDGEATVGGEIGGPALRVTVSIRNGGSEALDLEYLVVNMYWGEERVPAGTIMQPGGAPFSGSLAPGEEAEGIYLFTVAEEDRGDAVITVDHQVGEPIVVFRGDLG